MGITGAFTYICIVFSNRKARRLQSRQAHKNIW